MLDYTFLAELYDGTLIEQHPDDVSKLRPLDKSAFYDVVMQEDKLKRFSLVGKGHILTVDLTDGHIELDGNKLYTQLPPKKSKLRVIYFRRTQQRLVMNPDGTSTPEPILRYYIGWQTDVDGKNYKFEMGVD